MKPTEFEERLRKFLAGKINGGVAVCVDCLRKLNIDGVREVDDEKTVKCTECGKPTTWRKVP